MVAADHLLAWDDSLGRLSGPASSPFLLPTLAGATTITGAWYLWFSHWNCIVHTRIQQFTHEMKGCHSRSAGQADHIFGSIVKSLSLLILISYWVRAGSSQGNNDDDELLACRSPSSAKRNYHFNNNNVYGVLMPLSYPRKGTFRGGSEWFCTRTYLCTMYSGDMLVCAGVRGHSRSPPGPTQACQGLSPIPVDRSLLRPPIWGSWCGHRIARVSGLIGRQHTGLVRVIAERHEMWKESCKAGSRQELLLLPYACSFYSRSWGRQTKINAVGVPLDQSNQSNQSLTIYLTRAGLLAAHRPQ